MPCRKCQRETPPEALYCPWCGTILSAPAKRSQKPRTRPNGTGTAFRRGKTWYSQVTIGEKVVERDGQSCKQSIRATKGGFKTKREALEYCPKLRELALNKPKEKPRLTMKQIYDLWLPTHETKVSKSTMDCYKAAWRYFKPLHDVEFSEIDLDDLQECLDDCDKGKRTKENMKALAGLLMKYALPRHQTDMNYAEFLYTGSDAKGTHPAFTRDQVELIRQQIGVTPHAEDVYCLIYTGFRPTEMFMLRREDYVDGVLYSGIKTEAGKNRAVPVSPRLADIISDRLQADSEWLFPKDDGTKMSNNYFRDAYFYPVLAAAGIQDLPTKDKPAHYVPYSCRHTFANMLKDVPGSDKDKAGLIGHEDYRTTKKHYQSVELDALKAIVPAL